MSLRTTLMPALGVFALLFAVVPAFADDDDLVDPAPSGREESVIVTPGPGEHGVVTIPGRDSPVDETTQGNVRTYNFAEPSDNPNNATIIYRRQ